MPWRIGCFLSVAHSFLSGLVSSLAAVSSCSTGVAFWAGPICWVAQSLWEGSTSSAIGGVWASTDRTSCCGIMWLLAKMRNMLLTALHSSCGTVVVVLIVNIFVASVTLRNGGPGLMGFHCDQQMPLVYKIENFPIFGYIGKLHQNEWQVDPCSFDYFCQILFQSDCALLRRMRQFEVCHRTQPSKFCR